MTKKLNVKAALLAASLLSPLGACAATLAKADDTDDRAACNSLASHAQDVCVAEAKAKQTVGLAEPTSSYTAKARFGKR